MDKNTKKKTGSKAVALAVFQLKGPTKN